MDFRALLRHASVILQTLVLMSFWGRSSAAVAQSTKSILVIGDSLTCGPFGAELVKRLLEVPGRHVTMFCAVSSAPVHWVLGRNPAHFKCNSCADQQCASWFNSNIPDNSQLPLCGGSGQVPRLTDILSVSHYDEILVALGTNTLPDPPGSSYSDLLSVVQGHRLASCLWIGPPHFAAKTSESRALEASLASFYSTLSGLVAKPCPLLDSRPFTANPQPQDTIGDGVHRSAQSGRAWADGLFNVIPNSGEFMAARTWHGPVL